ncbi:MAG TPA: hypothetical protein PKH10_00830 [bacterium]|nr:hypothetical protein [bacterium]
MMLLALMLLTISEYDLLQKAAADGFLYRNVAVETVEKCPAKATCITAEGSTYLLKRLDTTAVTLEKSADGFALTIAPDKNFTNYRLFIREESTVRRIEVTQKRVTVLDKGSVTALQLVGVGAQGPVVIWQKDVRATAIEPFTGDLLGSMNVLRKKAGLPPLTIDKTLAPFAAETIARVKKGDLSHYSGSTGSIRHSGVRAKELGENLFSATTLERAWLMMLASPSHLFNILSPSFRRCFVGTLPAESGLIPGIVIFAD